MIYWSLTIGAYLIGSLSSAILVSMLLHLPDPRKHGSLNPGATNVLRLGSKVGAGLTLLGDILKGTLPILVVEQWISSDPLLLSGIAIGAFSGHLFPIYFKFTGGKGVATALGIYLALNPFIALIQIGTWIVTAFVLRYSSLAAIITTILTPVYVWFWLNSNIFMGLTTLIALLLIFRHKKNIQRLLNGTEPKINFWS
ncbi:MAG: acyl-phosphate glycerol 3-phosphate acyltransferase [Acidiferrobacteraceae bacterium]|jgi:glycerol-3-phosphate acyltransferase PlsY|nr:acyl-phosphate glycerol 3-phosphate acyltransferase [Acidiferrobacteraceae bacterium]|tara:strand:- start:28884 stop:29477 length:594 start_codon:yes stop_codon:yes gene_type:complete